MAAMIPDEKKEEIRDRADLVEVAQDYVKLKRSGRSWKGLCPFHDEKTPSFHITPDLGIYKCFGCGASGDVFNFVMEMEGVGFVEAMRTLADRFGVSLPEQDDEENDEEYQLREGIYHALKYAGVYYHRQLMESNEAEKARQYLQKRGYNHPIIKKYGLGYAPRKGDAFFETATDSGLNKEYLLEAGLIKPSQRDDGFYDAFRGRLMFPIFNPTGKVIAFAGRALGSGKTAKYINSSQTKVYNKSEVLYGVNFAKNAIRKNDEAILVEGYTDVISLQQYGVENVVASSGTSLTPSQLKLLNRYGETLVMIYDADLAGATAMKRGINLALDEGLDVKLLELPEGDDPDSFIRQFGKDSFLDLKQEKAEDFVSYLIHKAQNEGQWDDPSKKKKTISEVLESIAHIPDKVARETFLQHLNSFAKVGDRALHDELGIILQEIKEQKKRAQRRQQRRAERGEQRKNKPKKSVGSRPNFDGRRKPGSSGKRAPQPPKSRPGYEKELIRLMLMYGRDMIDYIGSNCSEQHFEDKDLRAFYGDVIERYKAEKEVTVEHYAGREHPYPELVGEITLEEHQISERHAEKVGVRYKRDKNPYESAKGALKAAKLHYLNRLQNKLQKEYSNARGDDRRTIMNQMKEVGRQRSRLQKLSLNELFPDPDEDAESKFTERVFEYKMNDKQ
ncbi:MAG TPA: DNA primase [Balneolaceae bacterium]|nr:DNA primase [Balneolaceae bacterium]